MPSQSLQKLALFGGEPAISRPLTPRKHFSVAERNAALRVVDQAIAAGSSPIYGGDEEAAFCKFSAKVVPFNFLRTFET